MSRKSKKIAVDRHVKNKSRFSAEFHEFRGLLNAVENSEFRGFVLTAINSCPSYRFSVIVYRSGAVAVLGSLQWSTAPV